MTSSTNAQFIANRYEIRDVVGRGGMGVVYRCYDHVTRSEVALKQMLVAMKQETEETVRHPAIEENVSETEVAETISVASPDTWKRQSPFVGMVHSEDEGPGKIRLELSHEFETLARLRHPNIITVLDYGFDALKLPFFTMPLLETPTSITEGSKDANLDSKINLLVETLQALAYLHHHKIIHRDLKPDNALLTTEGSVKLLDFGLAVIRERTGRLDEDDETMLSGTIPYMAPELVQGGQPSTRSDIYAFGMIAYELLAGYYPFKFNGVAELIMKLVSEVPSTDELDIAEPIKYWLENLLQVEPEQRSSDALEVLKELTSITSTSIPVETKAIQESYLQTARYVGRDQELSTLLHGLRASRSGQGSSWLIIGETGYGKTRLINELRILALVNGFHVLQGHGTQGSLTPYQILREPIKRLLLTTPIDANEANTLKTLLPDLETILGRSVPESVQDEVEKYSSQLSNVILKLFKQQTEPTLLILDDLHWATESIEILSTLVATVSESHLMIVATQRPDSHIDISADLNEMNVLRLDRLPDTEITNLARSILGDVALRADVQEILKKEAQGNVNFLLEVIRSLLQEVQHLRDIARMQLPKELIVGGINEVLRQRLAKIAEADRQLFNMLAVMGLEIDDALVDHFAEQLGISSETWFNTLFNYAIIEREGEVWQITHERLRQVGLSELADSALPQLHEQVASALEQLYPNAVEKAGMIAYHWGQAGNEEHERLYLIDAADYALRVNSFRDAVRLYRRALELQDDDSAKTQKTAELRIKLGESLMFTGDHEDARQFVEEGLSALGKGKRKQDERARALALLADIDWRTGQFEDGKSKAQQALEIAETIHENELTVRLLSRLGLLAFETGAYDEATDYYERGLDLAKEHQDQVGLTMLNNNYGMLALVQGDLLKAKERFDASLSISEENDWTYRMASTLVNLGVVEGSKGDLAGAIKYLERSLSMARSIGDRRGMTEALDNLGFAAQLQEDYQLARQYLEESLALAETIGNRAAVPIIWRKLALVFEKLGDFETTQEYLMRAIAQANDIQATPTALHALADLARVEADAEQAVQWAEYIIAHEATRSDAKEIASKVIEDWVNQLGADTVAQYQATAWQLSLKTLFD